MSYRPGYVYIAMPVSGKGFPKIGRTARAPLTRIRELKSTCMQEGYVLVSARYFNDCVFAETFVKRRLKNLGHGVPGTTELFDCTTDAMQALVDEAMLTDVLREPPPLACPDMDISAASRAEKAIFQILSAVRVPYENLSVGALVARVARTYGSDKTASKILRQWGLPAGFGGTQGLSLWLSSNLFEPESWLSHALAPYPEQLKKLKKWAGQGSEVELMLAR